MKRLFGVVLLLFLAFSGCASEIDNPEPIETKPSASCITVTVSREQRDFGGFTAGPAGDADSAVKLVQAALERYPAGFADQWGPVEIILVGDLTGTESFPLPMAALIWLSTVMVISTPRKSAGC